MAALKCKRKNDKTFTLTFTEDDVAVDLTGDAIYFSVYDKIGGTALIESTATITTPTSGVAQVVLDADDTDIDAGPYVWDFRWVRSDGKKHNPDPDAFTVEPILTTKDS